MSEVRLIDANALIAELAESAEYHEYRYAGLASAIEHIKVAPTIEAEPVRHGTWILKSEYRGTGTCSECYHEDIIDPSATHCRYCGAKMDGDTT